MMNKQKLYDSVDKNAEKITALSDAIWDFSELSMQEYKSAAYYCDLLEQEGFRVERKLCGIPTAFSGSFGSGKPRIGILVSLMHCPAYPSAPAARSGRA